MSNLRPDPAAHESTYVIEFSLTPERAAAMILEDDPELIVPPPKAGDPIEFRVVVQGLGSCVDVFYRYLDFVGDPTWARLLEGVIFRNLQLTIYRRHLVVEAFRRLIAGGASQRLTPTGALLVSFD